MHIDPLNVRKSLENVTGQLSEAGGTSGIDRVLRKT